MKKIIKILIGLGIFIVLLYFGIVYYFVEINFKKYLDSQKCNFTHCELLRYHFTNALANLDNEYNISIDELRKLMRK